MRRRRAGNSAWPVWKTRTSPRRGVPNRHSLARKRPTSYLSIFLQVELDDGMRGHLQVALFARRAIVRRRRRACTGMNSRIRSTPRSAYSGRGVSLRARAWHHRSEGRPSAWRVQRRPRSTGSRGFRRARRQLEPDQARIEPLAWASRDGPRCGLRGVSTSVAPASRWKRNGATPRPSLDCCRALRRLPRRSAAVPTEPAPAPAMESASAWSSRPACSRDWATLRSGCARSTGSCGGVAPILGVRRRARQYRLRGCGERWAGAATVRPP